MTDRYWFDNSLAEEGARLRLLERIADPRSIALFRALPVRAGWRCAELGAGAGSMVAWLSDEVGSAGSVVAVDRDLTPCRHLHERSNVELVQSTLESFGFVDQGFDLIHTRNVLMHVDDAEAVLARMVAALRPDGVLLVEEADYYPLAGVTSPLFGRVAEGLVGRWTWARHLPTLVNDLGLQHIDVVVDAPMLRGGSAEAAFWAHTFRSAENRLVCDTTGHRPVSAADVAEVIGLLEDPTFWTPFAAVVCVSARAGHAGSDA